MYTQPQVTLSPIHNPQYEAIFSKHGYGTHHTQKIHVILSKCDNVIENIQIHMSRWVFFWWFENLHKCE